MEKNKSIISKLNSKTDLPLIKDAPDIWGGGTMLIPNPIEVMKIMDSVKYGTVITLDDIREKLSKKYKTTIHILRQNIKKERDFLEVVVGTIKHTQKLTPTL